MNVTLCHTRTVSGPEGSAAVYERRQGAREKNCILVRGAPDHGFEVSYGFAPIAPADIIVLPVLCKGHPRPVNFEQFLSLPRVGLQRQGVMNTKLKEP